MNKNYWCGIIGVYQIWHGQWSDPEVRYKNYICNEWDLQESMYITMKDRIADGEDWGDPDNDRDFMNFCKQNADLVKQDIMELSTGGVYESKKTMLRKDKTLLESLTRKYGRNEMLNNIKRYSNGRNSISNKFYYLEDKLTEIFETYDIDYFSVNQNKAIPTLIIEVNGYKYPFECVGFIFDGVDVSMDLQSGKTHESIELPLIDLDDIRTIAEISDWLKENEDAIIASIVEDVDKILIESSTKRYGKKNILNEINENKQDKIASLYKREIFNYLDSLKWDNLYDIIYEFGYGDEYHELVDDIMDALGLDEMEEHYDYLYPYMERIIKEYLIKNKMWR